MTRTMGRGPLFLGVLIAATLLFPVRTQAQGSTSLDGTWLTTVSFSDGGEFVIRLDATTRRDGTFEAFSRRGAVTELIGRPKALVGRLMGALPPKGALVRIERGTLTPAGDSALVRGVFASPLFGSLHVRGALVEGELRAELRRDTAGTAVGTLKAVRGTAQQPVRDYGALAAQIEATFAANLYDPHLVHRPEWRTFLAGLHRRLAGAVDDADAMAAFYALRPKLGISHVELFRDPSVAMLSLDSLVALSASGDDVVGLTFPAPGVAHLRITRFNSVRDAVTRAFERIDAAGSHTLILDVRGNPGGDVTSMIPVAHLLRDSLPVGVFLGRRWYAEHRGPPDAAQLVAAPAMTSENSTARSVIDGVREHGILRGIVPPLQPHFAGDVYLLIDGRSGSASEPLAHVLRATGRATLIGENTAGAMLSAPPHHVGDGWILVLPESDYFTEEGIRLEGRGVAPHISVRSADAMLGVVAHLRTRSPVAAAMLEGHVHADARRWALATHSWVNAIELEPWNVQALIGAGRAYQEAGAWEHALEAYSRVLQVEPSNPTATYQFGRAAALSGRELQRGVRLLRQYVQSPPPAGQPAHAAAHWRLGMILEKMGDVGAAQAEYERAVALDPDNADYRNALVAVSGS
jgi:carboxyl-terminal processing protease